MMRLHGHPPEYEIAMKRAIELKKQGYITKEVVALLREQGFTNPKTQKPYGRCLISKWVAGINSQAGKSLRHLSESELALHRERMRERQRALKRQWYRDNIEYAKSYGKRYMRETRAYYRELGLSYDD